MVLPLPRHDAAHVGPRVDPLGRLPEHRLVARQIIAADLEQPFHGQVDHLAHAQHRLKMGLADRERLRGPRPDLIFQVRGESPKRRDRFGVCALECRPQRTRAHRPDRPHQILFLEQDRPGVHLQRRLQKRQGNGFPQRLPGARKVIGNLPQVLAQSHDPPGERCVVTLDVAADVERAGERHRVALELPQVFQLKQFLVEREGEERVVVRVFDVE